MANQGEAEQVTGRVGAYARDPRESGEVPLEPTHRVPRVAAAARRLASDRPERDTLPMPARPADAEELIELPVSRRVTQRPPEQRGGASEDDDADEDGIIGLPIDAMRIDSDWQQDADEEILGLPSQLPGADDDPHETVGRAARSRFSEIPPPAPLEAWEKRPADEFDLEDFDLDDTIIYPSED